MKYTPLQGQPCKLYEAHTLTGTNIDPVRNTHPVNYMKYIPYRDNPVNYMKYIPHRDNPENYMKDIPLQEQPCKLCEIHILTLTTL